MASMVTVLVISSPLLVVIVLVRIHSRISTAVPVMTVARRGVIDIIIAARILFGVCMMMTVMTIPTTAPVRSSVSTTVAVVMFGMQKFLVLLVAGQEWKIKSFLLAVFGV